MTRAVAGDRVTPSIRLVRRLGGGGMGSVWIARHLVLDTDVAVKFMASPWSTVPSATNWLREPPRPSKCSDRCCAATRLTPTADQAPRSALHAGRFGPHSSPRLRATEASPSGSLERSRRAAWQFGRGRNASEGNQYSSRTRANTDQFKRHQRHRKILASLLSKLPADLLTSDEAKMLSSIADHKVYNLIQLIYRSKH